MPETEQDVALNPKKFRIPKIFKNRVFIFVVSFFVFFIGAVLLVLLDERNKLRPKWAEGFHEWFKSLGLTFDVSMATWLMFFIIFGVFFLIFFMFNF